MCQSSAGTSPGSSHLNRPNGNESDRSHRQLITHVQSLLKLLESLPPETASVPAYGEPETIEVYDYRYVNLFLPENTGHEIDLNLNEQHLFIRIAL